MRKANTDDRAAVGQPQSISRNRQLTIVKQLKKQRCSERLRNMFCAQAHDREKARSAGRATSAQRLTSFKRRLDLLVPSLAQRRRLSPALALGLYHQVLLHFLPQVVELD